jgi:hypothetical protein
MAARNIYVYENGKKIRNTAQETIDFLSIKVGASALEIKESATATGHFDLGAVRLTNVADPVNDQDVATKKYAVDTFIPLTQKAANLGVATLDAGGKIPSAQIPGGVLTYKGTWAASTNTPTLADGTGVAGSFYIVSDAGVVNFGAGNQTFQAGDWVLYNGTVWQQSHNGNNVDSVNGQTGIVVLGTDDISEGTVNQYFTDARALAAAVQSGTITTGVTKAPTHDAVHAALALKADDSIVVKSVNGVSPTAGAVTITTSDIAQGTNLYFTDAAAKAAAVSTSGTISSSVTDVAPNQKAVFDALALKADLAGEFELLVNDNAGSLSAGQIVYIKANGHVDLAKADALATCSTKLGIVMETIATTATGKINLIEGKGVAEFTGMTPGVMQFLSATTAGAITITVPSIAPHCIVPLGKAINATKLGFNPEEVVEILS